MKCFVVRLFGILQPLRRVSEVLNVCWAVHRVIIFDQKRVRRGTASCRAALRPCVACNLEIAESGDACAFETTGCCGPPFGFTAFEMKVVWDHHQDGKRNGYLYNYRFVRKYYGVRCTTYFTEMSRAYRVKISSLGRRVTSPLSLTTAYAFPTPNLTPLNVIHADHPRTAGRDAFEGSFAPRWTPTSILNVSRVKMHVQSFIRVSFWCRVNQGMSIFFLLVVSIFKWRTFRWVPSISNTCQFTRVDCIAACASKTCTCTIPTTSENISKYVVCVCACVS